MQNKQLELLRKEDQVRKLLITSLRRENFETLDAIHLDEMPSQEQQVLLLSISTMLIEEDELRENRMEVEYYTSPVLMLRMLDHLSQEEHPHLFEKLCCYAKPILLAVRLSSGGPGSQMPENIPDMHFGPLTIQHRQRQCILAGKAIDLTRKELDLLTYMAYYRNLPLTRAQLLDVVWGKELGGSRDIRTVDTHVKRLRKKLGPCGRWVATVRGVGYCFRWQDQPLLGEDPRLAELI